VNFAHSGVSLDGKELIMSRRIWIHGLLAAGLALAGAQAASAKYLYSYAVKFVCGYNDTNLGFTGLPFDIRAGEQTVKFGNYATDINIFNFNVDPNLPPDAIIQKDVIVLVDKGRPVGREPRIARSSATDNIVLKSQEATMDDCNRIAELLWGAVPTPFPLTVGFFLIQSTVELDVTAVYTAEVCSNWVFSPQKLDCLDANGQQQGVGLSIDVRQVTGHRLF
jgi:hypothetical protein